MKTNTSLSLKDTLTDFIEGKVALSIRKANTLKLILNWAETIGFSYYRTRPKIPNYIKPNKQYYVYIGRYLNSNRRYILLRTRISDLPTEMYIVPIHIVRLPATAYEEKVETTNNKKEEVVIVKKEEKTEEKTKITSEEAKTIVENSLKLIQALNNNLYKLL